MKGKKVLKKKQKKGGPGFLKTILVFEKGEGRGGQRSTPIYFIIFILRTQHLYKGTLNNKARLYLG